MYKCERNNNANVYDDAHAFNGASAYADYHACVNANYYAHASPIYAIDNYAFYVLDNFNNFNHNIPFLKALKVKGCLFFAF